MVQAKTRIGVEDTIIAGAADLANDRALRVARAPGDTGVIIITDVCARAVVVRGAFHVQTDAGVAGAIARAIGVGEAFDTGIRGVFAIAVGTVRIVLAFHTFLGGEVTGAVWAVVVVEAAHADMIVRIAGSAGAIAVVHALHTDISVDITGGDCPGAVRAGATLHAAVIAGAIEHARAIRVEDAAHTGSGLNLADLIAGAAGIAGAWDALARVKIADQRITLAMRGARPGFDGVLIRIVSAIVDIVAVVWIGVRFVAVIWLIAPLIGVVSYVRIGGGIRSLVGVFIVGT